MSKLRNGTFHSATSFMSHVEFEKWRPKKRGGRTRENAPHFSNPHSLLQMSRGIPQPGTLCALLRKGGKCSKIVERAKLCTGNMSR